MPSPQARPLFFLVCLVAPVGVIAAKALVPVFFIVALWLLIRRWRNGELRRPFQGPLFYAAILIATWALISALWALDGAAALTTFAKLAGVLLSALVVLDGIQDLQPGDGRTIGRGMVAAFVVAALVLALESLSGLAGNRWYLEWRGQEKDFDDTILNRAEILLLLSAWPTAYVLWQWAGAEAGAGRFRTGALAVIAVAVVVIMIGVSNSNQLAALVALVGAVFAAFTGKWLQKLLAGLVVIGFLAAPLLPTTVLAPERWAASFDEKHYSALHRLHIWNFAAQRITDAPVIGWGLDAARRIPGGDTKLAGGGNVMSVHTHNGSLQIWLELGAVGALIFAGLLAALWLRIAILEERTLRAGGTGLLLSALMVANLSFGIWQTWWMASLALSGLLFMIAQKLKLDERLNI